MRGMRSSLDLTVQAIALIIRENGDCAAAMRVGNSAL